MKRRKWNKPAILLAAMLAFSSVSTTAFADPGNQAAVEELISGEETEVPEETLEDEALEAEVPEAEEALEAAEEDPSEITGEEAAAEEAEEAAGEETAESVEEETAEAAEEEIAEAAEEETAEAAEEGTEAAIEEETISAVIEEEPTAAAVIEEETAAAIEKETVPASGEEIPAAGTTEQVEVIGNETAVAVQNTRLEAVTINLEISSSTEDGIYLEWTQASGADTYIVYRNSVKKAERASYTPFYYDKSIVPDTTYSYYVVAQDSNGNELGRSSTKSGKYVIDADYKIYGEADEDEGTVELRAGAVAIADTYVVYRNGVEIGRGLRWDEYSIGHYSDSTAEPETSNSYYIVVLDKNGNKLCQSNTITVTMPAAIIPVVIYDVGNTTKGTVVYWKAYPNATSYTVTRTKSKDSGETPGGWSEPDPYGGSYTPVTVSGVTGTNCTIPLTEIVSGPYYIYTVKAYNGSKFLAEGTFGKIYLGTTTMKAPTCTRNGLRVSWPAVQGAKKYVIFRAKGTGTPNWKYLTTVDATDDDIQEFNNNGSFEPGAWYAYTVRALWTNWNDENPVYGGQPAGRSVRYREPVKLTKLQSISSGVRGTFTSVAAGYTYGFYRAEITGSGTGTYALIGTTTSTTAGKDVWITDTTAANGKNYSYYVRCLSKDKKTPLSSYANTMVITYKKP